MADEVTVPLLTAAAFEAPAPKKLHVEQFLEDEEVAELVKDLAPLTIAGFINAHQAPRTRDEWVNALDSFTTGRL